MSRRKDVHTAELVGIAVLTRNAFGADRAVRYAQLAGLSPDLSAAVLNRPAAELRRVDATPIPADRRRVDDQRQIGKPARRHSDDSPGG
ncbi:hypothetical protein IP91_00874 [Pseudoduganella lurida]|uniref:Uncharacterized protein n=1 Tax=Pseudoduganella lurida TaxID=1036180 RepID=A0A562RLA0_9BURK|nr:hypothetical protein [Pseudoduganella lurida]TWI69801.1 hypothetical protein IP91_00874 [Pseudoduganella lurida]